MAKAAKKTGGVSPWKTDKTHLSLKTLSGQKWRAGVRVTPAGVTVAKAELSDEHVAALVADRDILTEEVDAPKPADAD